VFERMKRTLVESYVGAIALGYLLVQVILHLVDFFMFPITAWLAAWAARIEYWRLSPPSPTSAVWSFRDALPELERFLILLLVWYLLLRWLYFKPVKETAEPLPNPEQPV
jgi:hypothetical protein